jgi:hypothetical protein
MVSRVISFPSRWCIFTTARGAAAFGAMKQSLLCRQHIGLITPPNLQSRLLDGAAKRKRRSLAKSTNIHRQGEKD